MAELAEALVAAGGAGLERPCLGREKLGDGTVAAVAAHAIDNYGRIAQFIGDVQQGTARHAPGDHAGAHRPSELKLGDLLARLGSERDALARVARLSDDQLDSTPAAGVMRFADGERTLEQVLAALLKHQRHQIDAVAAA